MPPKKKGPKDATLKSGAATIAEQATRRCTCSAKCPAESNTLTATCLAQPVAAMSTTPNSRAPNIRTGLEEQTADIRGRKRNNSEVSTASKAPSESTKRTCRKKYLSSPASTTYQPSDEAGSHFATEQDKESKDSRLHH